LSFLVQFPIGPHPGEQAEGVHSIEEEIRFRFVMARYPFAKSTTALVVPTAKQKSLILAKGAGKVARL